MEKAHEPEGGLLVDFWCAWAVAFVTRCFGTAGIDFWTAEVDLWKGQGSRFMATWGRLTSQKGDCYWTSGEPGP
jgi:hypothetical protein